MGFEIERKFLIKYPDIAMLESINGVEKWTISQSYLIDNNSGFGRRIRKIISNGKTTYFYTEKQRINAIKRIENEKEISEKEYQNFLEEKNPSLNTINKIRYRIPKNNFIYEVDVFDFYKKIAVLEVELNSENQQIIFPDFINYIYEVTADERFSNFSLSKEIVCENDILANINF